MNGVLLCLIRISFESVIYAGILLPDLESFFL